MMNDTVALMGRSSSVTTAARNQRREHGERRVILFIIRGSLTQSFKEQV
jgi:hypothetical protein